MSRPRLHDDEVVEIAATIIAEGISDEYGTLAERISDIREALESARSSDGYDIAKELERAGWVVDAELVADLDGGALYEALERAEEQWVARENPTARFGIGASIKVSHEGGALDAVVYAIDGRLGKYSVRVPSLGHVDRGQLGVQGLILNWEAVEQMNSGSASDR